MTTVNSVVTRAYRKLGVSGVGDTLTADEIAEGVDALNAMLHGWKLRGVDITHADAAAVDDFPLGDEFVEGAIYLLASRLSPDYMVPQAFDADDWFRGIQAAYMTIDEVAMPSALVNMPSQRDMGLDRGDDF